MMLSTRLVDLETKHRLDLECCAKKFETIVTDLKSRVDASEQRNLDLELLLHSNHKVVSNFDISN
jgi:hypothetical protein